ncbi:YqaA family protein [uncultured Mailhella sp.]|uniref:YqaA family protein n=1 Tax=uncultured Mailhella sp. TaxID=1981031 RepID=UPI0025F92CC5|nr:YqaA family protein [uncultured Mailhella sp.]
MFPLLPSVRPIMKEYALMFVVAFVSATILPAQSEAVLVALVADGDQSPWALVAVATAGNSLGSATNWWLGLFAHRFMHARWFPVSPARLLKAERWYHKYGRWSLLLSWMPVMGDALTLAAGVMREPFRSFFSITLTAKLLRYLVLVGLYLAVA